MMFDFCELDRALGRTGLRLGASLNPLVVVIDRDGDNVFFGWSAGRSRSR